MNRLLIILAVLFVMVSFTYAQDSLCIFKNDGSIHRLAVVDVDSMSFKCVKKMNYNVKRKNGAINTFIINSIKTLTFSDGDMCVNNIDGSTLLFALWDIQNLKFTQELDRVFITQKEDDEFLLKLFPNPVQDQLTITYFTNSQGFIYIYSVDSNLVYSKILNSKGVTNFTINVSAWKSGMYICRMNNGEIITVRKFIKN